MGLFGNDKYYSDLDRIKYLRWFCLGHYRDIPEDDLSLLCKDMIKLCKIRMRDCVIAMAYSYREIKSL